MFRGPRGRLAHPTELPSLNKVITYLLTFINASKPVKTCHVSHVNIEKLCKMYSIYASKVN